MMPSTNPDQSIVIVRAGAADVSRVAPLFDLYRRFYGKASDESGAAAFLGQRLSADETVLYLALSAVNGGAESPAGFIHLFPSFSSISLCRAWILNDLFVHPEFRCLGVGRRLMARAKEHCRETGAGQLWLQTDPTNATAQRLYEACGMTRKEILEYTLAL